jgi:hypothetical protein
MEKKALYGKRAFAEELGVSEATLGRWLKGPKGNAFEVSSVSNAGGGLGRAYMGEVASLHALKDFMTARTSEARRRAAAKRWHPTDVSSGSVL